MSLETYDVTLTYCSDQNVGPVVKKLMLICAMSIEQIKNLGEDEEEMYQYQITIRTDIDPEKLPEFIERFELASCQVSGMKKLPKKEILPQLPPV